MMGNWKHYVLSVIVCALCCGMVSQILPDNKSKALIRLISGTILAIAVLHPLSDINLSTFLLESSLDFEAAEYWTAQGKEAAEIANEEYIMASCEAYILDKARRLGAEIHLHIILDENRIPSFAEIEGAVAPDVQIQLQNILSEDMGIPKENQTWTWNQENSHSSPS